MNTWSYKKKNKISKFSDIQKQTFNHCLLSWICELSLMNGYSNKIPFGELNVDLAIRQTRQRWMKLILDFVCEYQKFILLKIVFSYWTEWRKAKAEQTTKRMKINEKCKKGRQKLKERTLNMKKTWNRRTGTLEMFLQFFKREYHLFSTYIRVMCSLLIWIPLFSFLFCTISALCLVFQFPLRLRSLQQCWTQLKQKFSWSCDMHL